MAKLNSLSIFFPAYNDAGSIHKLVLEALKVADDVADNYEIIIVNDGSSDETGEIIDNLAREYEKVRIVHHERNKGYGGALKTGFKEAKYGYIFYTDGDGQYDVNELRKLVDLIGDADLITGYKIKRSDPTYRTIMGKMYQIGAKILFNLKVEDVDCDFRLMKKDIFNKIDLEMDSGSICIELMKKVQNAGFKIKQVPVNHYARLYGGSQFFRFSRVYSTLKDFLKLWWKLVIKKNG